MNNKKQLLEDVNTLIEKAELNGYSLSEKDIFALGYLAGQNNLVSLLHNKEKLIEAIKVYDTTDNLGLLDTISEPLIDLDVL